MDPVIVTIEACGLPAMGFAPDAWEIALAYLMLAIGLVTDVQFLDIVEQVIGHIPPIAQTMVAACVGVPS